MQKRASTPPAPSKGTSLAVRLLRVVFSIYLFITVLITGTQMYNEYTLEKDAILSNLEAYENIFGSGIATALWNLDEDQLSATLKGLTHLNDIAGVRLLEPNGKVIFEGGKLYEDNAQHVRSEAGIPVQPDLFYHQFQISYNDRHIGDATLISSTSIVLDKVKHNFIAIIVNAVIKTVVLWLLFLWAFKRFLTTALDQFTQRMEATRFESLNEDDEQRITTYNAVELERLDHVYQAMKKRIVEAKLNLEQLNSGLEEKVKERTKDYLRQQSMLEAMSFLGRIGAWEYDLSNQVLFCSDMTRNILELEDDSDLSATDLFGFIHQPEHKTKMEEAIEQAIKYGKPWHLELQMKSAKGDISWIMTAGQAEMSRGRCIRLFGAIEDIDERIANQQLLIEAKDKAELADQAKSEFLASMSHEIRTPMNGIIGMLNILLRSELRDQERQQAELALASAESLLSLLNDILDFSKIEAGKLQIEATDFNLEKLFSRTTEMLAISARNKDLELVLDLSAIECNFATGDPNRLRQVLTNLVDNAIKFTPQGSIMITAASRVVDGGVLLSCEVTDTGVGIEASKQQSIFGSFTQADVSTTRKYGGTGLGLAIVKNLCQLMGGDITLESTLGHGSTFTFTALLGHSNNHTAPRNSLPLENIHAAICVQSKQLATSLQRQLNTWRLSTVEIVNATELVATHKSEWDMIFIDRSALVHNEHLFKTATSKLIVIEDPDKEYNDALAGSAAPSVNHLSTPVTPEKMFSCMQTSESVAPNAFKKSLASTEAPQPLGSNKHLNAARILLVEDNLVNQMVARTMIQQQGLDCDIAENGLAAIKMLNDAQPDTPYELILMDCQMPQMDGYTTTQEIRKGKAGVQHQDVPIIAMTANAMMGDKERCLAAGMNDYISKPIEPETLRNGIARWLSNKPENNH